MSELSAAFFQQNAWANRLILAACRDLTDEQLDATAVGVYGSIRDTLHHIVGAEGGYAFRLGHTGRRLMRDDPWPGFDTAGELVDAYEQAFVAACDGDPGRIIRVGSPEEPYDVAASVLLVQAFNHGTEHRSQICSILTALGIEPPDLSGWDWGLATERMRRV